MGNKSTFLLALGELNGLIYGKHQNSAWHTVNVIQVFAAIRKWVARCFQNIPVGKVFTNGRLGKCPGEMAC